MKIHRHILIILLFILVGHQINAAVITAVGQNRDWNNSNTWDLNRIPQNNDVVIIPAGITVEVSKNQYHGVPAYPTIQLYIYGVLQFVGQGQLNVDCESIIMTKEFGTIPFTGCNCNQITMGTGLAPWKGTYATVANGNSVLSSCNSTLASGNNLEVVQLDKTSAYPSIIIDKVNESTLRIKNTNEGVVDNNIYDFQVSTINGLTVYFNQTIANFTDQEVNLKAALIPGIYLVRFSFDDNVYTKKIIF